MEPVGNGSHSEPLNNIGAGNSQQRRTSSISTNTSPTVSRRPSHYFVRNATTDGWATPSRSPERVTQKFGSFSRKLLSEVRVVGSTLRRSDTYINDVTHRTKDYDDPRYLNEDQAGAGNGVRVWYESYTTIDWIHDSIKESSRLRRVRSLKGYRGFLQNIWDRFQGWLVVTITGIVTALIAGGIVTSEAILFDLKEGYCERDWKLAKRFCCPYAGGPDWDGGGPSVNIHKNGSHIASNSTWTYTTRFFHSAADPTKGLLTGMGNRMLTGWAAPVAFSPKWGSLEGDDTCPGWIVWGDKVKLTGQWRWMADYGFYVCIAIAWASIASLLTIYLTSSELYNSKKDLSLTQGNSISENVSPPASPSYGQPYPHATESSPLLSEPADAKNRALYTSNGQPSYVPVNSQNLSQVASEIRAHEALPTRKVLYFGSGSGISEVKCILSGFVIHGYLGFWTLFTKSVGLTLSVASGLSLGKEGPFVHIASCVGNIVCRVFPKYETNESKRREILSCACAAGVAVAFGAPVGGVLFSLEEVSYYFPAKVMFRSFFCAMVAAATLRLLDPFGTGKIVLFQVTYDRDWHWVELAFFVLIGLFGGVYGALFTKLNMFWSRNVRAKSWMARHPLYEVIVITMISVGLAFLNDYTRMSGPELIADLFSECHEHESLEGLCVSRPSQIGPLLSAITWAMISKGVLTIITFGIKLPAGIFIPTLAVGACFGRIVGLLVQYSQWTHPEARLFQWCSDAETACIVPGVYAMVGAAATLSGVTRTTVSLVVIMFELTGTLTYSVPVMLAVLVARTVADGLEQKGIYDLVMEFSGLPYLDAKEEHTWQGVSILDTLDTDVEVISLDDSNTVTTLRQKLQRLAYISGNPDGGFPIVTAANKSRNTSSAQSHKSSWRLVGYIAAQELEHSLNRLNAIDSSVDPSRLVCTFNFLPRPTTKIPSSVGLFNVADSDSDGDTGDHSTTSHLANEEAENLMRNSALLQAMNEPCDLSMYADRAPITLTASSPLELVQQMFVKLGVRYLVVLNTDGTLKGIIFKKRWLAFLHSLESKHH